MSFQPVVPLSGIGGWQYMQRTQAAQMEVFNKSPLMAREIEYFKENISNVTTAEELVGDRTLLKVALGAFGLDDDLNKQAYVRKILEEGTDDDDAFANRVVDPSYANLAKTFGFGNATGSQTGQFDFAANIIEQFEIRQFEVAVGNQDNSLRLAMNFKRMVGEFANHPEPKGDGWYAVMGSRPMRAVISSALGLPDQVAFIEDIEKQAEFFRDAASKRFGGSGVDVFLDPDNVDKAINNFLVREQLKSGPSSLTRGSSALTLMQNAAIGQQSFINLVQSNF